MTGRAGAEAAVPTDPAVPFDPTLSVVPGLPTEPAAPTESSEPNKPTAPTEPAAPAAPQPLGNPKRAVACLVAAQCMFALMDATGKHLAGSLALPMVVFARNAFTLLVMLLVLVPLMGWAWMRIRNFKLQLVRGLVLFGFTTFFFTALKFLPQAEATAINYLAPLFVMVLAGPVLRERVRWWHWVGVAVGCAGMLLVVRPSAQLVPLGVACALATMVCNVAFQLLNRKAAQTEHPMAAIFFAAGVGAVGAVLTMPAVGSVAAWGAWPANISTTQWLLMASFGVTGFLSQYLFLRAYFYSSASFVATLIYLQTIWSVGSGWLFFGQLPDAITFVGIGVITVAGVAVALYDAERSSARPNAQIGK
jgi:drug/metabolite transporter (DMT)-like permease